MAGRIYALLAAFYYWLGKITGYHYREKWALIHFIIFTLAINIVFLPMHALGIAGMARRIPDYADGYLNWNSVMTLGSFLTFISLVIFFSSTMPRQTSISLSLTVNSLSQAMF